MNNKMDKILAKKLFQRITEHSPYLSNDCEYVVLDRRTKNILYKNERYITGHLVRLTENQLRKEVKNLEPRDVEQIKNELSRLGLELGMKLDQYWINLDDYLRYMTTKVKKVVDKYIIDNEFGHLRKKLPFWFDTFDDGSHALSLEYETLPSMSSSEVGVWYIENTGSYMINGGISTSEIIKNITGKDEYSSLRLEDTIKILEKIILNIGENYPGSIQKTKNARK
ncbi:MAG: hypothetical protein V1815_00755 [Candidatus Woesearchaeota archaeon]